MRRSLLLALSILVLSACRTAPPVADDGVGEAARPALDEEAGPRDPADALDDHALEYVRLVLAVGRHDPGYVDAYYGPEAVEQEVEAGEPEPLPVLAERAADLEQAIASLVPDEAGLRARQRFLLGQLAAVQARLAMLSGRTFSFDEASAALYGAVAPSHDLEAEFGPVLAALESALPGEGDLAARYRSFRSRYEVPADRVEAVFRAAIDACRDRTAAHVALPEGEAFTLELVEDKPWGGYNWYQGRYASLIQINVSLPTGIDRAVDIACHEGYPGHHLYNSLLEQRLVRERGWVEMTVYPLFSPQSLIAEGTANYGIEVAFPGDARLAFEQEVLYPLAGLDPASAPRWAEVRRLMSRLTYAGNEIARRYVDGAIDAREAAALLERWLLMNPAQAAQRVRFIDTYGSYVINYNLGRAMVRDYVEARGGVEAAPERRWEVFVDLLSSPRLPGDLRVEGEGARIGAGD